MHDPSGAPIIFAAAPPTVGAGAQCCVAAAFGGCAACEVQAANQSVDRCAPLQIEHSGCENGLGQENSNGA